MVNYMLDVTWCVITLVKIPPGAAVLLQKNHSDMQDGLQYTSQQSLHQLSLLTSTEQQTDCQLSYQSTTLLNK